MGRSSPERSHKPEPARAVRGGASQLHPPGLRYQGHLQKEHASHAGRAPAAQRLAGYWIQVS